MNDPATNKISLHSWPKQTFFECSVEKTAQKPIFAQFWPQFDPPGGLMIHLKGPAVKGQATKKTSLHYWPKHTFVLNAE